MLGVAAAVALVSCGGGGNAKLLPGNTAKEITANLDKVKQLASGGDCAGAQSEALQVSEQIDALGGVDKRLKQALRDGRRPAQRGGRELLGDDHRADRADHRAGDHRHLAHDHDEQEASQEAPDDSHHDDADHDYALTPTTPTGTTPTTPTTPTPAPPTGGGGTGAPSGGVGPSSPAGN